MPEPRERPIIFSAPMVRALLKGCKAQTRRIVKPQPKVELFAMKGADNLPNGDFAFVDYPRVISKHLRCPYGVPGEKLWVREGIKYLRSADAFIYPADGAYLPTALSNRLSEGKLRPTKDKTIPSIHMPRWASRITLEVTGVRVERLKDISEEDSKAEGAAFIFGVGWTHDKDSCLYHPSARESFFALWRSIHGEDSIQENPWLWVIEFQRLSSLDKPRTQ